MSKYDKDFEKVISELKNRFGWGNTDAIPDSFRDLINDTIKATQYNMNKAKENSFKKYDFEILFKDSAEYFLVENAGMIQEGKLIRFICFNKDNKFKEDVWFPCGNIHRVKRYKL